MAYRRFLINKDYEGVATHEHMRQVLRDIPERIDQAEAKAEMQLLEYLDQYYEIEKILAVGKNIREYNHNICYPSNAFFIYENNIVKTLCAINGLKKPTKKIYWKHIIDFIDPCLLDHVHKYSQQRMYSKGEIVQFGTEYWECLIPHGYEANEIHIPGGEAWREVEVTPWEPNMEWEQNQVCSFMGQFYQYLYDPLNSPGSTPDESFDDGMNMPDPKDEDDLNEPGTIPGDDFDDGMMADSGPLTPDVDDKWGLIGEYSEELEYDYAEDAHDYVVAEDAVFYPILNPNPSKLVYGHNISIDDPRNQNVIANMVRIAYFHLNSIISPTNVPETVRWGYEDAVQWLYNASKFKINPQIPRKCERGTHHPKVDWACETFMRDYNPNQDAWLI